MRECALTPGCNFNLVDDSEPNFPQTLGQFRALTLTAAPEGYVAVLAVLSTAVRSQLPTVLLSQTIKSTMAHAAGTMGAAPQGEPW